MWKLSEIKDITSGHPATRLRDGAAVESNKITILSPASIHAGYFDESMVTSEYLKEPSEYDRIHKLGKFAKDGDIVMKLSSPYEACLIVKPAEEYVIPSYCCIIRSFPSSGIADIPDAYICAVLNSNWLKAQISKRMSGSKNPMLKISDLKELTIPHLNPGEMKAIGEMFWLNTQSRKNMAKLLQSEKKILNNLIEDRVRT